MRERLFSVTLADCDVETFTVGGHGGSGKDTSNTGVRIRHRASGAVGIGRDERSQLQNKRAAFKRMASTQTFRAWVKLRAAQVDGANVERAVDEALHPRNLRVEMRDADGKWVKFSDDAASV